MPNNYWNEINIYGDKETMPELKNKIVREEGKGKDYKEHVDFEILLPMPKILHRVISPVRDPIQVYELDENGEFDQFKSKTRNANTEELKEINLYPYKDWYEWARHVWGTKWNAYDSVVEYDEKYGDLMIGFMTAWCPPKGWMNKVEELCKSMNFEYYHSGWDEDEQPRLLNKKP